MLLPTMQVVFAGRLLANALDGPYSNSVEMADEHDVAAGVQLGIEDPSAVRRDRQAIDKIYVDSENLADLSGHELEVLEGLGITGGHEINATPNDGPATMIVYGRHATQL